MRIILLVAMCGLLAACTTKPIFPPEVMTNVETDTFDFKTWKEHASHPSSANVIPRKVELEAEILNVIQKPNGVVVVAQQRVLEKYPGYGPKHVKRNDSLWFAIAFNGHPELSLLQPGNELIVVGTTDRPSAELIDGTPTVLPHLLAQCLHLVKTNGLEVLDTPWQGSMGYYPPEQRTVCLEETTGSSLPSGQEDEQKSATGS
jgi:starvation-inducible outer membrane lipoprotein